MKSLYVLAAICQGFYGSYLIFYERSWLEGFWALTIATMLVIAGGLC